MNPKIVKTGYIFTIVLFLSINVCVGHEQNISYLPWEVIGQEIRENIILCSKVEPSLDETSSRAALNYAFKPEDPIEIRFAGGVVNKQLPSGVNIRLSRWQNGYWKELGNIKAEVNSDHIQVKNGLNDEGFYKVQWNFNKQNNDPGADTAYVLVCANWKKDILLFLRSFKRSVETAPDPQLIHSTIVTSHIDHAMDMVERSATLSPLVLEALTHTVQSKTDFQQGRCPDLVIGMNKIRLRRYSGAPIAIFNIDIPPSYDGQKKWPLLVRTAPRFYVRNSTHNRSKDRKDVIGLEWVTVHQQDVKWKDYQYILNIIDQKLNIDQRRIYLDGYCENAAAAMSIALHYPDEWADCYISTTSSFKHLTGNALNLPLYYTNDHPNSPRLTAYYDFAVQCFEYHGCHMVKNIADIEVNYPVKNVSPRRVKFTADSLSAAKAYWVKINGRTDENLPGHIEACVEEQSISVKTNNVDAYTLDLKQAPVDHNKPVEIIENGQHLESIKDCSYIRKSAKYNHAKYIKNHLLGGPLGDSFTEPYVVVYGKMGNDAYFLQTCASVAKLLANGAPCISDLEMTSDMIKDHNLILVGSPETNSWLKKIGKNLPVQNVDGAIMAHGKTYNAKDLGAVFIYPNPLNQNKYVSVFSATSTKALWNIPQAFNRLKSMAPADVGIFELLEDDDLRWSVLEKFNTVWEWHDDFDRVLLKVKKMHPQWQWRQWLAKVIKEQQKVDIVICEDYFKFPDVKLLGECTYRDLFHAFKNEWIVIIKLDGKSLRQLFMIPFNPDVIKRKTGLVVDGLSLIKQPQSDKEKLLKIGDLENDKKYLVALPHECINGQHLGAALSQYEIMGETYLIPTLKEYLAKNKNLEMDVLLDSLTLNIF